MGSEFEIVFQSRLHTKGFPRGKICSLQNEKSVKLLDIALAQHKSEQRQIGDKIQNQAHKIAPKIEPNVLPSQSGESKERTKYVLFMH